MWSDSQGHKEVNVRLEPMFLPPKPEFSPLYHIFCLLGTQPMGTSSQAPEPHAHTLQALLELLPQVPSAKMSDLFLSLSSCRGNPWEWKWVRNRLLWSRGFASPPWTWRVGSGEGKSQIAWNSLSGLSLDLASWGESGARRREGLTWDLAWTAGCMGFFSGWARTSSITS